MDAVARAVEILIISAGSVDTLERIRWVLVAGAAGFTIGTAVFNCRIVPGGIMEDQIRAVLAEIAQ